MEKQSFVASMSRVATQWRRWPSRYGAALSLCDNPPRVALWPASPKSRERSGLARGFQLTRPQRARQRWQRREAQPGLRGINSS